MPQRKSNTNPAVGIMVAYLSIVLPFFLVGPASVVFDWSSKGLLLSFGALVAFLLYEMIKIANRG
jgi:hypothetical protein